MWIITDTIYCIYKNLLTPISFCFGRFLQVILAHKTKQKIDAEAQQQDEVVH